MTNETLNILGTHKGLEVSPTGFTLMESERIEKGKGYTLDNAMWIDTESFYHILFSEGKTDMAFDYATRKINRKIDEIISRHLKKGKP